MNNSEVDAIKGLIEKSRPKLEILIMGPGEDNNGDYAKKCYKKRCQIKDFLAEKHKAVFPEVALKEAKTKGDDIPNTIAFEKSLIEQYDRVIILLIPSAPGVKSEVDTFSVYAECAKKMHLYYDYSPDMDYSPDVPWHLKDHIDFIKGNGGTAEEFCEDDIESCSLLTKIGVKIDQVVSAMSMWPYKKYQGIE